MPIPVSLGPPCGRCGTLCSINPCTGIAGDTHRRRVVGEVRGAAFQAPGFGAQDLGTGTPRVQGYLADKKTPPRQDRNRAARI